MSAINTIYPSRITPAAPSTQQYRQWAEQLHHARRPRRDLRQLPSGASLDIAVAREAEYTP